MTHQRDIQDEAAKIYARDLRDALRRARYRRPQDDLTDDDELDERADRLARRVEWLRNR